jgi:hypothetical protein
MRMAARADAPRGVDDALPWDVGARGQRMQRIADRPRRAGVPEKASDLPVRRDLPRWDLRHQTIDRGVEIRHLPCLHLPSFRPAMRCHPLPSAWSRRDRVLRRQDCPMPTRPKCLARAQSITTPPTTAKVPQIIGPPRARVPSSRAPSRYHRAALQAPLTGRAHRCSGS